MTLSNLAQTYDGSPKAVVATTTPAGLAVTITYNGSTTAPSAEGNYNVVATINGPSYTGSATGVLVINPANVSAQQTVVLGPGQTNTISTAPTQPGLGGAAVTARSGGAGTMQVMAANYSTPPVGGAFKTGASYVDVRVWNPSPGDSLTAKFYYPNNITGTAETALALQYYNGTNFILIPAAIKDTTDNLDGTVSGGRFTVTFDANSTPKISELTGTIIAMAPVFRLTSRTPTRTTLDISFPTGSGNHYTLLGASSVTGSWTNTGQVVTGDGTTKTVTVTVSGSHNFYRIQAAP